MSEKSLLVHELWVESKKIELVDLTRSKLGLEFSIEYASEKNFFNQQVYPSPDCFLELQVAIDLMRAHEALQVKGFGLLIFDGYRPWSVTRQFWEGSSESVRAFLADPKKGSVHNRASAVDLGLFHLSTKSPAEMPSGFDEMNEKAYIDYQHASPDRLHHRSVLRETMLASGFTGIRHEWWHYNHPQAAHLPVMDLSFEEILQAPQSRRPLRLE